MRRWSFPQWIYVLGDHFAISSDLIEEYHARGVQLLLFDLCENLVIRLLQDLSTYYSSKGVDRRSNASPLDISTLDYFDWAKAALTQANQLAENGFDDARRGIEKEERKTQSFIKVRHLSVSGLIQQLQIYKQNASLDSVVVIFVSGLETIWIELDWSIGYVVSCTTATQLKAGLTSAEPSIPAIAVSSSLPSAELLSSPLLLRYYYFSMNHDVMPSKLLTHQNLSHVSSVDQLISELYHKLAEHYREDAIQAAFELRDQQKVQRLLQKSTQCYKQLEEDTAKTLQRYAELLKRNPAAEKQSQENVISTSKPVVGIYHE